MMENKTFGLVLSGGGALGAAHLGAYKAIQNIIRPKYVIGTSAGAIVGAAIAIGLSPEKISEHLYQKSLFKLAFDFSIKKGGIIGGQKILDLLKTIFDEREFSDLSDCTLKICATDFNTGDLIVIEKGSIAEAIRASISIPGLFTPYWINGIPLVDGGLVANLPLEFAIEDFPNGEIIAVDILSCIPENLKLSEGQKMSVRAAIERSLRLIFYNQIKRIAAHPRIHLIKIPLESFRSADVLKLPQIEAIGYSATSAYMKSLSI